MFADRITDYQSYYSPWRRLWSSLEFSHTLDIFHCSLESFWQTESQTINVITVREDVRRIHLNFLKLWTLCTNLWNLVHRLNHGLSNDYGPWRLLLSLLQLSQRRSSEFLYCHHTSRSVKWVTDRQDGRDLLLLLFSF